MHEKTNEEAVDKNATPDFNIKNAPVAEQQMISGKFYAVAGEVTAGIDALKFKQIMTGQATNTRINYMCFINIPFGFMHSWQRNGVSQKICDR